MNSSKYRMKRYITSILHNDVLINALKIILCVLGVFVILFLAHLFKKEHNILTIIIYFFLFTIFPILVAILLRKRKGIRWHILVCAIMIVLISPRIFTDPDNYISFDSDRYLSGNSDFERTAAKYMPSKQMLSNSYIVYFEQQNYGDSDFQLYRISVLYDDATFYVEQNRLQQQYNFHLLNHPSQQQNDFYLDGLLYNCFVVYQDGCYGVAYHVCVESNTISYLFFRNDIDLSTMTAGDALKGDLGCERVITP